MKKITFLAICCVCIIAFNSCGNSDKGNTISYGGNRQKNYNKADKAIQECLDNFDFEAAHKILNQIPYGDDVIEENRKDVLQDKVYEAEITYLVDQNTDETWQRAYLLVVQYQCMYNYNQYRQINYKLKHCELLADYAIVFGHEKTVKQLIKYIEGIIVKCKANKESAKDVTPSCEPNKQSWEESILNAQSIITKLESVSNEGQ